MTRSAWGMAPQAAANATDLTNASLMSALRSVPDTPFVAPQLLLERLLAQLQSRLVGRTLRLRIAAARVQLQLADVRFEPSPAALAVGQLGDVDIAAKDVRWNDGDPGEGRLDELAVHFGNVHLRPGREPTLVVAPVLFRVVLQQETVAAWLQRFSPGVEVELLADGRALVGHVRGGNWGRAEVVPHVEGQHLRFTAVAVEVRGRRVKLPRPVPAPVAVDVPPLPWGIRPREMTIEGGALHISGALDEWRQPLRLARLEQVDRLLRRDVSDLDLSGWEDEPSAP